MRSISARQLATHLEHANPTLLDVREPWEFETCHIDGSINIPMGQIPHQLAEIRRASEVVVICHHGIRSHQVGLFLKRQGFPRVANLLGGIDAWSVDVDPEVPRY